MNIDRRTFLRGVGTAIALPYLEIMAPRAAIAQAAKTPIRTAYLFVPNGMNMGAWTPAETGAGFGLTEILQPFEPIKGKFSVLTGLAQMKAFANGDGPGDHARSAATWLTGVQAKKTAGSDIQAGISADQLAAREFGDQTKFASLELGCERGTLAGNCDSGYSCAYSSSISWRSENTPVAKDINPRSVFERLFGSVDAVGNAESKAKRQAYDLSILDFVTEDAANLRNRLGGRDLQKMDEYFNAVREIEERLKKFELESKELALQGIEAPSGIPRDRGEHIRLMGDMMVLALQSDLTRVCTFMLANEGSNRPYREINLADGHHDISHHGKDPAKLQHKKEIDIYHAQQVAYILQKMDSIQEENGTLLDNTMLLFGGGISDGDRHNHDNLPLLLAGGRSAGIPQGQHLVFPDRTPMTNLFLTMLDKIGADVDKLGDSTGQLVGLF